MWKREVSVFFFFFFVICYPPFSVISKPVIFLHFIFIRFFYQVLLLYLFANLYFSVNSFIFMGSLFVCVRGGGGGGGGRRVLGVYMQHPCCYLFTIYCRCCMGKCL